MANQWFFYFLFIFLICSFLPLNAQNAADIEHFEVIPFENHIEISWETKPNNTWTYFEVQYSLDEEVFQFLKKEAAFKDKSGANYTLMIEPLKFNEPVFYRLACIQTKGDTVFSHSQEIILKKVVEAVDWVSNPDNGNNSLKFKGLSPGIGEITVFDSAGEEIVEKEIYVRKGLNNPKIELNGLPTGLYYVQFKASGGEWSKWVLKTSP